MPVHSPMARFAFATLSPTLLLAIAALWGGVWPWLALGWISVVTWALDKLIAQMPAPKGDEFPSGDGLSVGLALVHLPLLPLMVWGVGGAHDHGAATRIGLLLGAGLYFGQIGHPNAHELIHRPQRTLRALGRMIYTTLLMGHHASSHLRVHHIHVATDLDPASAPIGMGFYTYAARALPGSFRAGWAGETALRKRSATRPSALSHAYIAHIGGALASLGLAFAAFGIGGALALLGIGLYALLQVLLSDYVQHYGLRRAVLPSGKLEPVSDRHSWNTPHAYSSAMMLNAPRHSDHHTHPTRHYPALALTGDMPLLPYSLPVMAVIALIPPLWRKVMDKRARQAQDRL